MTQCGRPTASGQPCKMHAQGAFSIPIACIQHFTKADEELRHKLWVAYGEGKIQGEKDAHRKIRTYFDQFEAELIATYHALQRGEDVSPWKEDRK